MSSFLSIETAQKAQSGFNKKTSMASVSSCGITIPSPIRCHQKRLVVLCWISAKELEGNMKL
jgi:hypothetical protein